jgi:hypothetical protein
LSGNLHRRLPCELADVVDGVLDGLRHGTVVLVGEIDVDL